MESEKVKEIKKVLEEGQFNTINHHQKEGKPIKISFADILTLINELESENKRQKQANKKVINIIYSNNEENQQLKDRIAELKKENKDYYDRLNNWQAYIDNHERIWKCYTNNSLKQFAERLKEKAIKLGWEGLGTTDIDKTLKEFLNKEVEE